MGTYLCVLVLISLAAGCTAFRSPVHLARAKLIHSRHARDHAFTSNQKVMKIKFAKRDRLRALVDPSYDLAAGSAVLGTIFGGLENYKGKLGKVFGAGAIIFTLFGGFVAYQTSTLSFRFDDDSFALVKTADGSSLGENVVVGGENDWAYSSFVNWDFWPSKKVPILVYFKETQTPEAARVEAPDIVKDGLEGQAHYFPAIARTDELTEKFNANGCKHL